MITLPVPAHIPSEYVYYDKICVAVYSCV